ncbi:hypothetical protein, partial [Anabaena sp. UHCC 0451]|uniref:hypothetical protein n=1 Tax=Anabaena sp. UHCC 0451 TaxID=2055235 RepID=UPI002B1F0788
PYIHRFLFWERFLYIKLLSLISMIIYCFDNNLNSSKLCFLDNFNLKNHISNDTVLHIVRYDSATKFVILSGEKSDEY